MLTSILGTILALSAPAPEVLVSNLASTGLFPARGAASSDQAVPYGATVRLLNEAEARLLNQALDAARARDIEGARSIAAGIAHPVARKLVDWALVDTSADLMSFEELARARVTYADWPRAESRIMAGERAISRSSASPEAVIAFFDGHPPLTVEGAIGLALALEATGRADEARPIIRDWWRNQSFDFDNQSRILSIWPNWIAPADDEARLNMLLLGPHGPATRAMIDRVSPEQRAIAQAVLALRTAYSPDTIVAGLTPAQAGHPAVVFERVRILRSQGREQEGFALLAGLPAAPTHSDGQGSLWSERRNYFLDALEVGNWQAAYDSMAGHGFPGGERMVDAEFFAGWVALVKLNDPARAARHFEALRQMSETPITQGRALYWLGRAYEAMGDTATAQSHYAAGAVHIQSFYGQLAAEKAGMTQITLPSDPEITPDARAAYEANEVVQATRMVGEAGEAGLLRAFAYHLDDTLPSAVDVAQLMDMVLGYGDRFGSMMVGRAASQRGWLMPNRQYPIRIPPEVEGAAPLPFTLAITRQESSYDPLVVSSAGARGMMQFLPSTASGVARRLGMPYSADRLWDPDYNMTLGSYHLGELMQANGGSMILAAVGYNAGPARPAQWIARCGDPRGATVDPIDFIECTPFTETRNYMMRVMENMQIYKARLGDGTGELTLSADLARGGSGPTPYLSLAN